MSSRPKAPLFVQLMRAPRRAYNERNLAMPYEDFRALLGAMAKRERPEDITLMWNISSKGGGNEKYDGTKSFVRLRERKNGPRVQLSVPEMVAFAHTDKQALYAYLHTCYALLRTMSDLPDRDDE